MPPKNAKRSRARKEDLLLRPRKEDDLLCPEEMPEYPDAFGRGASSSKASAEEVAAAALKQGALRAPPTNEGAGASNEKTAATKKKRKERGGGGSETVPTTESPHNTVDLSQHVMCDWSELGLGDKTGSGAWNAALRTQLIRSNTGASTVPQLSAAECLHRIQQMMDLPTVLPPEDSHLVSGGNDRQPGDPDSITSSEQRRWGDEEVPSEDVHGREILRDLYGEMVRQDVADGSEFRRELRFTTAEDLCNRMRQAESEMEALGSKERAIRENAVTNGLFDEEMQQEVNRMRGLI
jgi:hypothetical protein